MTKAKLIVKVSFCQIEIVITKHLMYITQLKFFSKMLRNNFI